MNNFDDMFATGNKLIGDAFNQFLAEAQKQGVDLPDAILLFASLLFSKAIAVIRAMLPLGTKAMVYDLVDEEFANKDLLEKAQSN